MKKAGAFACVVAASFAASATTALAAAPTATTGSATGVTASGATVGGTVNPNGASTTYHFDYGPTAAYGTSTPSQGPLSGSTAQPVSATINGLAPSTTYHFRLVATNPSGTTNGSDATFTTAASQQGNSATITATPLTVTFGKPTTLSGHVTGRKANGAAVDLELTPFPFTSPFKSIATGTTDQAGNFSFPNQRPGVNTRYRVTVQTAPRSTSAYVQVNVRPAVTFRVNDRTPARGQRVRFSGEVTPAHDGKVVRIERHTAKGWRTVTTPTLRATTPINGTPRSRYSRRIRVRRSGTYRVVFLPGDGDHVRATTGRRRLVVH